MQNEMTMHVRDEGSIFLLESGDEGAESWLAANLDPDGIKWGSSYVVEGRYVDDIVAGFEADGGAVNLRL